MNGFFRKTFSSLANRNYRLYFIGQAISLSGTWMQAISQDWLVLQLTNSGTALGAVTAVQFLPVLAFGAMGGVVADRFPKRKILYVTQSTAGLLALGLGILVATGLVELWMVYVFAFFLGCINAVDSPTRQAFVMEMVGKEELPNAVTLNSTEVNLARVIGPTLAGIAITAWGLAPSFFINSASYAAILGTLAMMRAADLQPAPLAHGMRSQFIKGLQYVKSQPVLRNTLIMMAIIGTLSYEFSVSLPLLAKFTFGAGAGGYAALTAAMGIGSVTGGIYFAGRRRASLYRLIAMAAVFGALMLTASVAPVFAVMLIVMVAVGVFSLMFLSMGNVILQLESDPQMRGRVMSLWTVAFLGSTPIGGPVIGWVGEHLGPRFGLGVGGLAALLAAGFGYLTCRRDFDAKISARMRDVGPANLLRRK